MFDLKSLENRKLNFETTQFPLYLWRIQRYANQAAHVSSRVSQCHTWHTGPGTRQSRSLITVWLSGNCCYNSGSEWRSPRLRWANQRSQPLDHTRPSIPHTICVFSSLKYTQDIYRSNVISDPNITQHKHKNRWSLNIILVHFATIKISSQVRPWDENHFILKTKQYIL